MTKFRFKLTTQVQLETLESNARTFGELKEAIKNSPLGDKISFGRKKEVREGIEWIRTIKLVEKNTLAEFGAFDEAVLPAGDSMIFYVTPMEHKGGMFHIEDLPSSNYAKMEEELMESGYNEIRSLGSKINNSFDADIDLSGKRSEVLFNVLEWLGDYYRDLEIPSLFAEKQFDNAKTLLNSAIDLIVDALDILEETEIGNNTVDGENTIMQLHEKALDLKRRLNS